MSRFKRSSEDKPIKIGSEFIDRGEQTRVEIPITMLATQGALSMPIEVIAGEEDITDCP